MHQIRRIPASYELIAERFLTKKSLVPEIRARERVVKKNLSRDQEDVGTADHAKSAREFLPEQPYQFYTNDHPLILICSHAGRDSRCGIMGPILEKQFTEYLLDHLGGTDCPPENKNTWMSRSNLTWNREAGAFSRKRTYIPNAQVAAISHITGHAWAGNVIIYFPKRYKTQDKRPHGLAGKGVWYGRVEPRHVEGIVEETVKKGRVIQELLRGMKSNKTELVRSMREKLMREMSGRKLGDTGM